MGKLRIRMHVANIVVFRWLEVNVVNLSTHRTIPTTRHPFLENLCRDVNQHRKNLVSLLSRETFQTLSLRGGSRKSVQDVAVSTVVLACSFLNQPNCQFIRNQSSLGHDLPHLHRKRRLGVFECAKDISGGDLRQFQTLLKQARLRAFASTRRTHQDYYLRHTREMTCGFDLTRC